MYLLSGGYRKTYGSEKSRKSCSRSGIDARRNGYSSLQENLQSAVGSIVDSIEEIGKSAEDEKMENAVFQAASALQTIMSSAGDRF